MKSQESAEMYLETILCLQKKQGQVRAVDIAREMGFSKPTISIQMRKFRENGYIEDDGANVIVLTQKGREIAESVYERHIVIARILEGIGVDKETARADACRIEHYISDTTFKCMKAHFKNTLEEQIAGSMCAQSASP